MENIRDAIKFDDSQLENYFSGNAFQDFMREIKRFPLLSDRETDELFQKYKSGDSNAFDLLVNSNLRLVVHWAYHYRKQLINLDIMDIIQEGAIGLMNAVALFDPSISKFSTYASTAIKRTILRSIDNHDKTIRKTVHFEEVRRKYFCLIDDCQKNGKKIPSDEKLCELLNTSMSYLALIKEDNRNQVVSLNKKVDDDRDSDELENFQGVAENNYNDIEINFDTHRLLVVLKNILSPIQYYVIYFHILFKNGNSLKNFAEVLNVSSERIRQIEEEALQIIKPYMDEESQGFNYILKNYRKRNIKIESVSVKPIYPIELVKYLYLKNDLSLLERKLFYLQLFGDLKYSNVMLAKELNCSLEELSQLRKSLEYKILEKMQDIEAFGRFYKNILKFYGPQIYNVVLEEGKIDEQDISSNDLIKLSKISFCSLYDVEKDIYLAMFNFKAEYNLPLTKLYNTYIKHINMFKEDERLYLECFVFFKKPKEKFVQAFPDSTLHTNHKFLFSRLEMLYYDIKDLLDYSLSLENYLEVKRKYLQQLSPRQILLLDLHYGTNGDALSLYEISVRLNEDYDGIRTELASAIKYVKSLYNNNSKENFIDKEKYKPYVNNPMYEYNPDMRSALQLYLFDNLDYGEIASIMNLPRARVSNIINDGLRRIDYLRFGIISVDLIKEDELSEFFIVSGQMFSSLEKKIICAKKLLFKENSEISQKYGIDEEVITKVIMRFNASFLEYRVRNVTIEEWEISEEINKPAYDSILTDEEKEVLSLFYGLKNSFNANGIKESKAKIATLLNRDVKTISDKISRALINIKARKISIIKPELDYMDRNMLDKLLDDCHLPISTVQRNIICHLLGLKGYDVKMLSELSEQLHLKEKSIRTQYKRAIVIIKKYINGEIEGCISYEEDILPNLKYFSKRDAIFLVESFSDQLTNSEIANKYNVKIDYVNKRLHELKNIIRSMVKGDISKRFNFECYRELITSTDLPFYGNLELAKICFELYTGESTFENFSIPSIKKLLNLECSEETIRRYIHELMLSIYRMKNGVKKHVSFTLSEISWYYISFSEEMNQHKRDLYLRTISTPHSEFLGSEDNLSDTITFDLLKFNYPDLFDLKNVTREEVVALLRKYHKLLNIQTINTLMKKFDIRWLDFMSKTELKRTLKLKSLQEITT